MLNEKEKFLKGFEKNIGSKRHSEIFNGILFDENKTGCITNSYYLIRTSYLNDVKKISDRKIAPKVISELFEQARTSTDLNNVLELKKSKLLAFIKSNKPVEFIQFFDKTYLSIKQLRYIFNYANTIHLYASKGGASQPLYFKIGESAEGLICPCRIKEETEYTKNIPRYKNENL